MNIFIEFPCQGGAILQDGQTYNDALEDHYAHCRICPNDPTEHEQHEAEATQKAWEAKVDAALKEAKEAS